MSKDKIRYKATIAGKEYTIIGARSVKHLQVVEKTLDGQLQQIEKLTKGLDPERRAVLAAVNAVSDQIEMQIKMQSMEEEIELLKQQLDTVQQNELNEQ
ncbi:cell division protein ZapA [Desemzia sp. RIT804]|uniref:cell division protein ZapA n=1 Tax=Desemzia sp. RIT 804 TaxID=2810209 RepID=UPI00194F21B3|nr:cell division protein ZapA [Desemzia sp. RIT 804]